KYFGISVGRSLLIFDSLVLVASLSYIDLNKMMYTLIFAYVFSRVIDSVLDGGYSAKGLLIMSEKNEEIAPKLMEELDRGITFLNGEGGFSKIDKRIIYMVLTPREISQAKEVIHEFDKNAFISVINVHEVLGEGFSYKRKKKKLFG
ncbi:MAG: YitT family protein, partial [Enterococcus lemanii]